MRPPSNPRRSVTTKRSYYTIQSLLLSSRLQLFLATGVVMTTIVSLFLFHQIASHQDNNSYDLLKAQKLHPMVLSSNRNNAKIIGSTNVLHNNNKINSAKKVDDSSLASTAAENRGESPPLLHSANNRIMTQNNSAVKSRPEVVINNGAKIGIEKVLLLKNKNSKVDDDASNIIADEDETKATTTLLTTTTVANRLIQAADEVEKEILTFFHGESRALQDGVISYSNNNNNGEGKNPSSSSSGSSSSTLASRLADRIRFCAQKRHHLGRSNSSSQECRLLVVFIGGAQASGRDIFYNQTYPIVMQKQLEELVVAAGLQLQVLNHAMDNDLGREGPQTNHMCLQNLVQQEGTVVDVIGWDFDSVRDKNVQFEAFVRWSLLLQQSPALILVNGRQGPHEISRRGKSNHFVDISPGHRGVVFEDDTSSMVEARTEPYKTSSSWRKQWHSNAKINHFWLDVFHHYAHHVDFTTIDPQGAIWHLDHLWEFSNAAFDEEKALPLVDCPSNPHPPPCNKIPPQIRRNLQKFNNTIADVPHDTRGVLCGAAWGCRHSWYGGTRSHALRAELNAIPLVQSLREAAQLLLSMNNHYKDETLQKNGSNLPPPLYCNATYCSKLPRCVTSYEPNLGLKLSDALKRPSSIVDELPQLGISQYRLNPNVTLKEVEDLHFAPLGYIDRKHAYRLSSGPQYNEVSKVSLRFESKAGGPLILCEPPCIVDSCPPKRQMPIVNNVTIYINDQQLTTTPSPEDGWQPSVELGRHCFLLTSTMTPGNHTLRLETNVVYPEHVLFSHVISY